ncbi:hypothetical protein KIW84_030630 [Lathyrus oleraceus]|uniref:DUF7745 domain-containing protein n=1 Tax=Pisum sativum TaxID=3888 RepID=A0A9D5AZ82_PEA|nr:hypothetical protein KIW84_030630 [Pisum sativum]
MERQRRNTKKYSFRQPDLKELRKLTSYVLDPLGFKARFGKLLPLLTTQVDEGLMSVLVQFYDPLYRCFTFPDFQLLPTLEEYAYLVGIPILDQLPFSGLESIPTFQEIADMLHIDESLVDAHMTTKGGIQGLPSEFLIAQATMYGKAMSEDAFEAIFVLLIYGLVLFPNIDKFVDVDAIRIFSSLNPVLTLLGDTYFSLHMRNAKGGGAIIIDSCGEFSNVPLGTCGGINYNPVLARRQLGFPLKDKPNNILLEGVFFQDGKDPQGLKSRMVHAWCRIHKKGRKELGPKNCIALEPYTDWVRKRAFEYLMPYEYPRPTPMIMVGPSTLPNQVVEELRDEDRSRAWIREREELLQQIKENDELIEFLEHQVIDDPDDVWTSLIPQSSKFWKRRYDRLAKEKADMEAAYEREVKRLRASYLPVSQALDDCAVTSTLHQKLKFVKNKKLVVVGGERALLVSHLSSFSYIDAEVEIGTPFQALSIAEPIEKRTPSFASYKDAKLAIERGATTGLGKMIELEDNESRAGIGFSSGTFNKQGLFKSGGFIHTGLEEEAAAVLEEDTKDSGNFIIPGGVCNNWVAVDIPTVLYKSTLISKPIEHNDPTPSPNFEFPVFKAEEDDVEEIPDEITRLLEHEEKIIQPHLENLETVNLGSEDFVREVKIGALLEESVKKGLI